MNVEARYSPTHSDPERDIWFFIYTVTILNKGRTTVQLVNRHWEITDGNGRVEHVRGPGVVGEEPVLDPGQSFRYSSGCPLPTRVGFMRGEYEMVVSDTGERFEAEVGLFSLRLEDEIVN